MASACVNKIGIPPESFLDCPPAKCPSYGWLSPRISFSSEESAAKAASTKPSAKNEDESANADPEKPKGSDPVISGKNFIDFEFCREDPVAMLPADELFSDGKLVPLHFSTIRQPMISAPASADFKTADSPKLFDHQRKEMTDAYLFSPKAPTCSIRWKGLLGLKKLYQNNNANQEDHKTASFSSRSHNKSAAARSLKRFLHRGSKSALTASVDSSLNLPLLKEPEIENESLSVSSRLSLSSSSSSGHEHDELPRLSLDSDKPGTIPRNTNTHQILTSNLSKVRIAKHRAPPPPENQTASTQVSRSPMRRTPESAASVSGVSVDSPRMNASGKVVFQSLERSSSSPSTFNGGPRYKHRGMERSYSANVRVTPVLNVPVCSLRGSSKSGAFGFPLFSSQQRKDNGSSVGACRRQQHHKKNRTDRT